MFLLLVFMSVVVPAELKQTVRIGMFSAIFV